MTGAVALAEHVGGSVEGFSKLMNDKAIELGLSNTHFVTPHGLDETEHYTTAYELAIITDYALQNKKFCEIVNTKSITININGNPKTLNNTNELLGNLNGVNGVKTGFTNNAGRCLVTSTVRNGHNIICVVLGADTKKIRTSDSVKLIEYAFANYEYVDINKKVQEEFSKWKEKNLETIQIIKGNETIPMLELSKLPYNKIPISKNNIKDIQVKISCNTIIPAPVHENQIIGKIEVKVRDETICAQEIIVKNKIEKKTILNYFGEMLMNYGRYIQQIYT